jgi:hypothetical protein
VNRHALLSLGLLITGIAAAVPGCGEETSNGNKGDEAGAAGKDAGGEHAGGTGSDIKPSAGAGGAAEAHGGAGGSPEGGTSSAGAGGVATGGAGGEAVDYGNCLGSGSFGDLGLLDGDASTFGDPGGVGWAGTLRVEGTNTALLTLDLYNETPPFAAGLKTLSNHVLADDDLNYQTCGLCLQIVEVDVLGAPTRRFLATSGTLSVTSFEGRLTGSASNLTFEEVTVADDDLLSTPVPGGCKSSIKSVSFDESTGEGGAGGGGGAGN